MKTRKCYSLNKKFDGILIASSETGDSINDAKPLKLSVNKDMKGIGLSNIKESLTAPIGLHNKSELIERVPYHT